MQLEIQNKTFKSLKVAINSLLYQLKAALPTFYFPLVAIRNHIWQGTADSTH